MDTFLLFFSIFLAQLGVGTFIYSMAPQGAWTQIIQIAVSAIMITIAIISNPFVHF